MPISQYQIGKFFADFAWEKYKIVIEYDGPLHIGKEKQDENRSQCIQDQGWDVFNIRVRTDHFLKYQLLLNNKDCGIFTRLSNCLDHIIAFKNRKALGVGEPGLVSREHEGRAKVNELLESLRPKFKSKPLEYNPKYVGQKGWDQAKADGVF